MPINPNARTEAISFREGAAWMWNYILENNDFSVVDNKKAEEAARIESLRRYPDYDPLPQPTSAPKGGMEP